MLPEIYLIIPSYTLMATIGLCVSILFLFLRCEKIGINFTSFVQYLPVCVVCSLLFARILFIIAMIPCGKILTINDVGDYLLRGGIVFYGGLTGAIIGIIIVSKYQKRNINEVLDFCAPAFPLFHFFARIGCLLAGCCYGIPWAWGIVMQGENIIRFPVQLLESTCNIIIFIIIEVYNYKIKSYKNNLLIYLCSYAFCRFWLEFFRGDNVRGIWFGYISTAQIISIVILAVYIMLAIRDKKGMRKYIAND